jgi:hypothetical protein
MNTGVQSWIRMMSLNMKAPLTRNFFYASLCLLGAAWFIFRD